MALAAVLPLLLNLAAEAAERSEHWQIVCRACVLGGGGQ